MRKTWTDRLPDIFGRRRIWQLECELEEAEGRIEELQTEMGVVSNEFEKDCWRSMRRLLDRCEFDWRDVGSDGVSAAEAEDFILGVIDALQNSVNALKPKPAEPSQQADDIVAWLMKASQAIYLATEGPVADDISPKLKAAAREITRLRTERAASASAPAPRSLDIEPPISEDEERLIGSVSAALFNKCNQSRGTLEGKLASQEHDAVMRLRRRHRALEEAYAALAINFARAVSDIATEGK